MNYTVSTTAIQLVDSNPARQSLWISNMGSQTIFVGMSSDITSSTGNPLYSGTHLTETKEGGNIYAGPYYAITSTATTQVVVWERSK